MDNEELDRIIIKNRVENPRDMLEIKKEVVSRMHLQMGIDYRKDFDDYAKKVSSGAYFRELRRMLLRDEEMRAWAKRKQDAALINFKIQEMKKWQKIQRTPRQYQDKMHVLYDMHNNFEATQEEIDEILEQVFGSPMTKHVRILKHYGRKFKTKKGKEFR